MAGMPSPPCRRHRSDTEVFSPSSETVLIAGDVLVADLAAAPERLQEVCIRLGLHPLPLTGSDMARRPYAVGIVEVIVTPASALCGRSVLEAAFRSRYGLTVAGLRRSLTAFGKDILEQKLQTGDTLLLIGPWKEIRHSRRGRRDFLLLNQPEDVEEPSPASTRAPHALLSLGVAVALMVGGALPHVQAALVGCLMLLGFRCIDMESAYRAIHWQSIVLIVGMLPFSVALQKTGGIALAAEGLIGLVGGAGPHALLVSLFAATAVAGLFISNTATAVLMAPLAIATAREMGLSPYPFTMIVALAASAAFMTPVSSPVNTLVLGPGRYRFGHFMRVGVPFTVSAAYGPPAFLLTVSLFGGRPAPWHQLVGATVWPAVDEARQQAGEVVLRADAVPAVRIAALILCRCARRGNLPHCLDAPPVNPLEQRRKLNRGQPQHAVHHRRPAERAAFHLLPDQAQATAVPDRILIRSARRERNTSTAPENGSVPSTSAASAAKLCAPLRKSTGFVASRTRAPTGGAIMPPTPGSPTAPPLAAPRRCQVRRAAPRPPASLRSLG